MRLKLRCKKDLQVKLPGKNNDGENIDFELIAGKYYDVGEELGRCVGVLNDDDGVWVMYFSYNKEAESILKRHYYLYNYFHTPDEIRDEKIMSLL
jgi:hypothetical protein